MKKRIFQISLIFLLILGVNLILEKEVFAGNLLLENGGYKLKYQLEVDGEMKTYEKEINVINIAKDPTTKTATLTFQTNDMNAMTIYHYYTASDWTHHGEVRGPCDADEHYASAINKENDAVMNVVKNGFPGEIKKELGDAPTYYDEATRAVLPGKTYYIDFAIPQNISNSKEAKFEIKAGDKKLEQKVGNLYEMKVPKNHFEQNFKNNKISITANYAYHTYTATWTVKVKYKEVTENGKTNYYIKNTADGVIKAKEADLWYNKTALRGEETGTKEISSFNLLCNVTINQWIDSVDDNNDGDYADDKLQYVDINGQMSRNHNKGGRKGWRESEKREKKVLLETGEYFNYKIRLENHYDVPVYVRLMTEVAGCLNPREIAWKNSEGKSGGSSDEEYLDGEFINEGNANINTGLYRGLAVNGEQKCVGWYYDSDDTIRKKGASYVIINEETGESELRQKSWNYEFIKIPAGKKSRGGFTSGYIEFTVTCEVVANQAEWNTKTNGTFKNLWEETFPDNKEFTDLGNLYNYQYPFNTECNDISDTITDIFCTYVAYNKETAPDEGDYNYDPETNQGVHLAVNNAQDDKKNVPIDENGTVPIGRTVDYLVIKQYDVSVNTFIVDVSRANGNSASGDYLVDDRSYSVGNNRKGKSEKQRKENPVYVENGDTITIRVVLENKANSSAPYYWNPKKLKRVEIPFNLHLGDIPYEITSIQSNYDKVDFKTFKDNAAGEEDETKGRDPRIIVKNVSNGARIEIDVDLQINTSKNDAIGWKESGARSVSSNIGYTEDNRGLPNGVRIFNYYESHNCCNQAWWRDYEKIKRENRHISVENWEEVYENYDGNSLLETKTSDYFQVKEYNVAIDQYIQKVEHQEMRGSISGVRDKETYNSTGRRSKLTNNGQNWNKNESKENNPVSVEYGDIVTYKIKIYNTNTDDEYYQIDDRRDAPYKKPNYIYMNIDSVLSTRNYKVKSIKASDENVIYEIDESDKRVIHLKNIKVGAGEVKTVTVKLYVEDHNKWDIITNEAKISSIKNINKYKIKNNSVSGVRKAKEYYKLNDYNVGLQQYITSYNAEMAKYNNKHGFTQGESEGFTNNVSQKYTTKEPLFAEKYEKLTVITKVTNNASGGRDEFEKDSPKKYNTRARPTEVTITVPTGLEIMETTLAWYDKNNNQKKLLIKDIDYKYENGKYTIINDEVILSPGDYINYMLELKIMESNFYLDFLNIASKIDKLTNINKNASNNRIVTDENISTKITDEDYMKLKDLVIAGTVWLDKNKNGYQDDEQEISADVTVKLYNTRDTNNPVAQTTIKTNGFYTFGRQPRANNGNYNQYYIEFEYDGVAYKATEIYGGNKNGQADGMQNLEGKIGSRSWRQGYSDLPDKQSGKREYMTDSNAYEFDDERNAFNKEYQTIGFESSYKDDSPNMDLKYAKEGHRSTLIENPNRVMTARSFITQDYTLKKPGVQKDNKENTNFLFLSNYQGYSNKLPETEYLKFINLGLAIREQTDLSIEADVHSVKTFVNGEEMNYNYYQNDADSQDPNYINKRAGEDNAYTLENPYELSLYQADYNYKYDSYYQDDASGDNNYDTDELQKYKGANNNERGKELNQVGQSELTTEITYRVKIHNNNIANDETQWENNNIPIETAINEVAIYYNKNFVSANNLEELLNKQNTVKEKNDETGIFGDSTVKSLRVDYGSEDELDEIIAKRRKDKNITTETSVQISLESKYGNTKPSNMNNYNVLYLRNIDSTYLAEGETKYIQITFTVDKDESRNLMIDQEFGMVAEISAYTTQYNKEKYKHKGLAGEYAGLVDRDSNPGNLHLNGIENYDNYEDDKYKVGININKFPEPETPPDDPPDNPPGKPNNTRYITGMVWEDVRNKAVGDSNSGIQKIGDGEYKTTDEDKPVEGVKVSLIEVVQTKKVNIRTEEAIYYEYPARDSKGNKIEAVTGPNGEYTLKDFIPGYYKVRFDYGGNSNRDDNIEYNGQDYKSTTYYNKDNVYYKNSNDNIGSIYNFSYFDTVKSTLKESNHSDAQDDEIRRLNVNSYSETMTAVRAKLFAEKNDSDANKEELTKYTHMHAESAIFYVKPEELDSSEQKEIDATSSTFNQNRIWKLENIDFGLQYRPENTIILDKNLSKIECITSNNRTLLELYFTKDEEGNVNGIDQRASRGYENVQFLPNIGKKSQGFAYINMDTEILQGCTIKVEYEMNATNQSEVDRVNQNLYKIRYESGAIREKYRNKVYYSNNYNANGTAAELLSQRYYKKKGTQAYYNAGTGKETYQYLKRIKKAYKPENGTLINGVNLAGTEYYGMYLGQTYYTGKVGTKDIVAQLKIDHILDYVDNDFTFNLQENNSKNKSWQTTTSQELLDEKVLDFEKVFVDQKSNDDPYFLVDKNGIQYDTNNRRNLALSVDDNKNGRYDDGEDRNGNVSLSRFLKTTKETEKEEDYKGTIKLLATKVLSANDIEKGKGLTFENISEITQYTSLNGRRMTLPENGSGGVIGNAGTNHWNGYGSNFEDDTDATEIITISPPTGLTK